MQIMAYKILIGKPKHDPVSSFIFRRIYPTKNPCSKFETFPKPCYLLINIITEMVIIPANSFSGHVRTLIAQFSKLSGKFPN